MEDIGWLKKQIELLEIERDQALDQGKYEAAQIIDTKISEWGASGSYVDFANLLKEAILGK